MKNYLTLTPVYLFIALGSGCSTEESFEPASKSNPDLIKDENILHFSSFEELVSYKGVEINPTDHSLKTSNLSQNKNFKSFQSIYNDFISEINAVEGTDEQSVSEQETTILHKYRDVVQLSGDRYEPIINPGFYWNVINIDKIYAVEDKAYKVLDNQYIVYTNLNKLVELKKIESLNQATGDFEYFKYVISEDRSTQLEGRTEWTEQECYLDLPLIRAWGYNTASKCKDKRRVVIYAKTEWVGSNGYRAPHLQLRVFAERQVWGGCSWRGYSTNIYWLGGNADVEWEINNQNSTQRYFPYESATDKSYLTVFSDVIGDTEQDHPSKTPSLAVKQIDGRAYTRGTGSSNPAVLDCTYF